jgi:chorismate synthase
MMLSILEGIPAGLPLSAEDINPDLARRQLSLGAGGRMRIEKDQVEIAAGVMAGKTTGAPIGLLIPNRDHEKWKNRPVEPFTTPRPGHADLNGVIKYGYEDIRPSLERASARDTVSQVAIGAVCRKFLAAFGIQVGGYVSAIGTLAADLKEMSLETRLKNARSSELACPDESSAGLMRRAIEDVMQARDTLGGLIEVAALGLPPGLGSFAQADRRLDARLAAAVLGVQAMKGVEIGEAFENARLPGSQAQDAIRLEGRRITRLTNRCGGLEGGVSTGQPLLIRAAMKPIATTLTPQPTVDLASGLETVTKYERSDFCPVPRAVVIVEAAVMLVLADALLEKLGGDSMQELIPRFQRLKKANLDDIQLSGKAQIWWED